ncbi:MULTISPECIES: hypothetical protein [Pseudomonas]|uniref:hypothetical protein n=1 Tax=Pseudomonas TaxID=286 RepID=UPI000FC41377|nr:MULTISPECIES: hypothetical protein [Pseudomonas]RUE17092.1 hypothetical protein IPC1222_25610 [Pseudomonas aeruginosa]CAH0133615.1 hypothetical protein SRABI111_00279 [Pseudomonas carnis]CAH0136549.1 hypothetical protein SRABI110_00423 [Pseudomonas carnis]CAH0160651.1 hypothetical protein SRABI64_00769 [Pseudomonas carnis]CAH0199484.1 hypothetical protein SRABI08_01857 [Pseudomonas carnis]
MKELQIANIKKMVGSGENREAISKKIDSTLEELFSEIASSLPTSKIHEQAVDAAKQLLEIYTNVENKLNWHESDMYGKIIVHCALLNPGQILTSLYTENLDAKHEITINGVTMNIHEAVLFFDDFMRIHQSMTKRFFLNKMEERDEEVSKPLAIAMQEYKKVKGK